MKVLPGAPKTSLKGQGQQNSLLKYEKGTQGDGNIQLFYS